jgi:ElaB/YqjD/DUF883 family membrane-anchored ribosome-binding protein
MCSVPGGAGENAGKLKFSDHSVSQAGNTPIYLSLPMSELPSRVIMEIYFKELISKDASLEKIVDDLERVVQGADAFAKSIGVNLAEAPQSEIAQRLQQLKERCLEIKFDLIASARAADRVVRKNPYRFIGAAVLLGMFVGARVGVRR